MNITGWSIDGCGLLNNCEERDLPNGLTLVLGPNEAGKTTLLDFIRAMLFTPSASQIPAAPLNRGRHGGRLFLTDGDGRGWTITRDFGMKKSSMQLTAEDGARRDQADLDRLLGHCDQSVFRSIFAFSLSELRAFDAKSKDKVEEKLFSTGIKGAGASAANAIGELKSRQAKHLRATPTTSATLNDLVREIKGIQARIDEARRLAGAYSAAINREAELHDEVTRWRDEIAQRRLAYNHAARLVELWPHWAKRRVAEASLASMLNLPELPDNAERILSDRLDRAEAAVNAFREASNAHQANQHRRLAIELDDSLARVAAESAELDRLRPIHEHNLAMIAKLDAQLGAERDTLNDRLRALGFDWNRDRLATFDRSILRLTEVRAWDETLATAESGARDLELASTQATKRLNAARREFEEAQNNHAGMTAPATFKVITRQEQAVEAFRAHRSEEHAAAQLLDASQYWLNDLKRQETASFLPNWLTAGLGGLALAGFAAGGWQAATGAAVAGAMFGVAAIGVIAATWFVHRRQAVDRQAADKLGTDIRTAQASIDEHSRVRGGHARSMAEAAVVLGLDETADSVLVAAADAELRNQRSRRALYERNLGAIADLAKTASSAARELESVEVDAALATARRDELSANWLAWKSGTGIPSSLAPKDAYEFFRAVQAADDVLQTIIGIEADRTSLKTAVAAFDVRVEQILDSAGGEWCVESTQAPLERLSALQSACIADGSRRKKAADLDEALEVSAANRDAKQRALSVAQANLSELYADANVADEAGFRAMLAQIALRSELLQQIAHADQRVIEMVGDGEAAAVRAELETGDLERWRGQIAERDQAILDGETERDRAVEARRDAETARRAIETSADLAAAEIDLTSKREEFTNVLREWQVARLAEELIRATMTKFEQERQPHVLADAGAWFQRVTAGRYARLLQRNDAFDIEDARGALIPPERLSRGTTEQLYLCLRLALAADFHHRGHQLPLVMDDVLVNFDPERARSMAELLCDIADRLQIILFTCHPHTVELLREYRPSCREIEMPRYGEPAHYISLAWILTGFQQA